MFYCTPCAVDLNWPREFWYPTSRGACEQCGQGAVCFDVPSRHLPIPTDEQFAKIRARREAFDGDS